MKVRFITFGCRLNKAEALQMEAEYLAKGWELTESNDDADRFVVRGCSVTARAQHECEKLIAHLKRHHPTTPLLVCGCLKRIGNQTRNRVGDTIGDRVDTLPMRTARAYLKVQDGCNGKCSFCIVPKFRGKSTSVPFSTATDKARRFIDAGYHEIVITGCNLSLYASEGNHLAELVSAIAELDAGCRVRIGSLEPFAGASETIHAMAEHENICRFVHLPVQSGSAKILRAMNRPYSPHEIDTLINLAVKLMPGIGLGCDIITGFPGETDIDFAASRGLLARHPFNNIHAFPYSERPGTPAAMMPDAVHKSVRSARAHELSHLIKVKRQAFAKSFIGKTVEMVIEDAAEGSGWTQEYLRCKLINSHASNHIVRKAIINASILRVQDDTLEGILK